MALVQILILSLVEGITEFLPISSTGHLILTSHFLGIVPTDFVKTFEIVIQSGAMCAVLLLYFQKIRKNPIILKPVIIGFLPAAIVGLLLYQFIKDTLLQNVWVTAVSLGIGGVILIILEYTLLKKKYPDTPLESISIFQSLFIGAFQSLAVVPGISRSGASIIGGILMGLSREKAVEFSFLLAVPTIFAATALDLTKSTIQFTTSEIMSLGIGFICSFFSAAVTIRYFLAFVKKNSFVGFGIYRIILAILTLLLI